MSRRTKAEVYQALQQTGVIAVIRVSSPRDLVKTALALTEGGVKFVEITLTVPDALQVIHEASQQLTGEVFVGAGTVLDPETARSAILAGADFIVGPAFNQGTVELCQRYGTLVIPGAYTPTEVLHAWENGADVVKVFPANLGGPQYFKDLKGPLPQVELLPTGGVNQETAPRFIKAGAIAVAVGRALADPAAIQAGDFEAITRNAQEFSAIVQEALRHAAS
jgi:2-dehydro-3-deoxyphosphogluconate aldolase/(4S)-4-hydroxy-2-oxoglutarate aldolase